MKSFLKIALSLSLLLIAFTRPARAQTTGPQYTVQPGDTLYGIARQFGLTLDALQAANPDINPAALSVGQALIIPGFPGVSGKLGAHPLEIGESLDSLALRLGLKRETLISLNRIVNPDLLFVNESVIVVDALDGPPLPVGITYPARIGEGWLGFAASRNQNPWALAALNGLPHPGLLAPRASVVVPGGDQPTRALPYPLTDLAARPFPIAQGHTLSLHLVTAQPVTVTGQLGAWPLQFNLENENSQYALLGIYRLAEPDLYRLTIDATDANGGRVRFSQPLPVRSGDYATDPPLTVDPATIDPVVTEPELKQLEAIVAPATPTRYWSGVFQLPSVGALRSVYGSLRSYNGGPYDSFHTGTDFSGAEDRPITAPAPGVVVFTGGLTVRGNATIIDHGWGVYTGYWHQSKILTQVGQTVQTGDLIGYQGATGRVTGPHLHWELWVGGFQVDPLQWTQVEFP
jgi:murein DD-endopeptidase MepM/ murein hydrolase activator NlpD